MYLFRNSKNCDVNGKTTVVRSYKEKLEEKTGSTSFGIDASAKFSIDIPIPKFLMNIQREMSASFKFNKNDETEGDIQSFENKTLEEYYKEAKCETHRMAISDHLKPTFTLTFTEALRDVQKAINARNEEKITQSIRNFIESFGTHYMSEVWLGASLISVVKYSSQSNTDAQRNKRIGCMDGALSLASSVGADIGIGKGKSIGLSVEGEISGYLKNCESENKAGVDSSFNSIKDFSTISRGSPPLSDVDEWARVVSEEPVPVRYELKVITRLFRPEWIDHIKITDDKKQKKTLKAKELLEKFESRFKTFCQTILGRECPNFATKCGLDAQCDVGEECHEVDNDEGYECIKGTPE